MAAGKHGGGGAAATAAMVGLQVGFAGLSILSKLALNDGMSPYVMTAYRNLVATAALAPVAFIFEWKYMSMLTGKVLFQILVSSVLGATMNQVLYFVGLQYTTTTVASALTNILPAVTFILAALFKMEKLAMAAAPSQAKLAGTLLCVAGSMLMTFYTGPLISLPPSPIHWRYVQAAARAPSGAAAPAGAGGSMAAVGAALVILSCVAWAVWFIIQAKMGDSFPAPYTTSALICFMAAIQCFAVSAAVERHLAAWVVGWNIRLVAVSYNGLVGSAAAFAVMSWCISRRGPLYVSMFSPLQLIVVAVVGWLILDDKIYVGSAIGSVLIVGGLYLVLWGKKKEMPGKEADDDQGNTSSLELEEGTNSKSNVADDDDNLDIVHEVMKTPPTTAARSSIAGGREPSV